jgi:hypothetical protein
MMHGCLAQGFFGVEGGAKGMCKTYDLSYFGEFFSRSRRFSALEGAILARMHSY